MFKDLKKSEFSNFFEANRLVYIKKRREQYPIGKGEVKSGEQIRTDLDKLLAQLRSDDPFKMAEAKKEPPRTHTDTQRHTRRSHKPEPYYEETVKLTERAVTLSGRREAKETLLMQGTHDNLYLQYMNPSFMMHLQAQPGGLIDKIYPVLDLVMKHPDDFDYVSRGGNIVHIVKKQPYEGTVEAIKPDFLVVMEGGEGHITRVRNNGVDSGDLKQNGEIPWYTNDRFNKQMPLYSKLWNNTFLRYQMAGGYEAWYVKMLAAMKTGADTTALKKEYEELYKNALKDIGVQEKDIKEIYVAMNILIPQRFADMVRARGLKWELEDERIKDILSDQGKQGKTYEDITINGYGPTGGFRMTVQADPDMPGVYKIYTKKYKKNPLYINLKGQILRQNEEGEWLPDPRYTDNVRRDYYYRTGTGPEKNKDLLEKDAELTDEDKKRMADAEKETAPGSDTIKRVEAMYELIDRRELVDAALFKEQNIDKLIEISLYLLPTHKKKSEYAVNFIRNIRGNTPSTRKKAVQWHRNNAKRILDNEDVPKLIHTRNDHIAGMLGVTLPPRKTS